MPKCPNEFFPVLTKIGCLLNLLTYRENTILGFCFVDRSTCRYKLVNVGAVDVVGCFAF